MQVNNANASGAVPESVLERLLKTSPGLEVWWDSSPLIYSKWANQLVSQFPPEKQPLVTAQLEKFYNPEDPARTLFGGVTTNPPLSLAAMQDNPQRWAGWISDYVRNNQKASVEDVFWA